MNLIKTALLSLLITCLCSCAEPTKPAPDDLAQKYQGQIVLYATSWCSYCQKMRDYFKSNNIEFVEHDVEASDQSRQEFDALGGKGVPVVLIKGYVVEGYNTRAIADFLEQP